MGELLHRNEEILSRGQIGAAAFLFFFNSELLTVVINFVANLVSTETKFKIFDDSRFVLFSFDLSSKVREIHCTCTYII